MSLFLNRIKEATTTTGTGTVTLSGTRIIPYQTWANGGAVNAQKYNYLIEDGNDSEWGVGTYTSSGTTFSRDVVLGSIIGGTSGATKINLSGSATIACIDPAESLPQTQTVITSGSQTSVTFTVPQYGSSLELIVSGRSAAAVTDDDPFIQFNGDTGNNYARQYVVGNGTTAPSAGQNTATSAISIGDLPGTSFAANFPGSSVAIIPNYTGAFYKTVNSNGGISKSNSSGGLTIFPIFGLWASTAAITSLKLFLNSGGAIANGSLVSLTVKP